MQIGTLIQLQLVIMLIILSGVFFSRKGLVSATTQKQVTDWIINLILPCNIISAFISQDMTREVFLQSVSVLVITALLQLFLVLFSRFFFMGSDPDHSCIMQYGLINSNASFVALPILTEIYGPLGAMLTSSAVIPQRITMWTAGLSLFESRENKQDFKKLLRTIIFHPCIAAVYVGLVLMVLPVSYPYFVTKTLSSIGNCTLFLALFLVGVSASGMKIRDMFSREVLYFNIWRLLLLPILVLAALYLLHVSEIVAGITVIMSGIPVGTTTAILCAKYGKDTAFASALTLSSTILSLLTVPLLYQLVLLLFG